MTIKTSLGTAAALVLSAGMAFAEYPEKPVSFIVPWPPGDLEDVLTRMIAEDFSAEYGVSAAVVNKPGGGGGPFPGAIEVANAPADGYTVGSFVIGVPVVGHQIGIDDLTPEKFDPRDFLKPARAAMKEVCVARMTAFGQAGNAAKLRATL